MREGWLPLLGGEGALGGAVLGRELLARIIHHVFGRTKLGDRSCRDAHLLLHIVVNDASHAGEGRLVDVGDDEGAGVAEAAGSFLLHRRPSLVHFSPGRAFGYLREVHPGGLAVVTRGW